MAIVKVGTYRNPPDDITDYEAIVAHLNAYTRQIGNQGMILTQWTNNTNSPAIALGSYISHGGVLYIVDTADYAISSPVADGTYYLKVVVSGVSLAVSWISDLTGYAWNAVYNGLYHADESQILPYMLVVSGTVTVFSKWKITNLMQGDGFFTVNYLGEVVGTYFNQGVKSTDSPAFASVDITTLGNGVFSTHVLPTDSEYVIPKGIYYLRVIPNSSADCVAVLQLYDTVNTTWRTFSSLKGAGTTITLPISQMVISDGVKVKVAVQQGAVVAYLLKVN